MSDVITLIWVAVIFFAAISFTGAGVACLIKNKSIGFDKGFLLSLSACLIALVLCYSIRPAFHRVYQDEFVYLSQSVNILNVGKPSLTVKGRLLQPELLASWKSNPKLPGFSWLEAVVLFFTKDFDKSYYCLNLILGMLSVALVYRIVWILSSSHAVAWWSAIFLACLPARITYSMSAVSDIAGFFFFLLFILFLCEYKNIRLRRIFYAALFCGTYSICIKPFYGILIVAGLAMALYIYRREGVIDKKTLNQTLIDIACLSLPVLAAVPVMFLSDAKAGNYSISYVLKNLYTSASYLFNYDQCTVLTSLAAVFAMGRAFVHKKDNMAFLLAAWFLMGIIVFSIFYSGGISYPGHAYSDRYLLILAFPFVFLAAKGMVDILSKCIPGWAGALFFIVLLLNAFHASDHLTQKAKDNFHYKKVQLLKQAILFVPNEAYVLDECAAVVNSISLKRSIQTEIFIGGDHPPEVVYLKGVADDLYDPYGPDKIIMLENILKTSYRCKSLTKTPITERDLSATPMLCYRR